MATIDTSTLTTIIKRKAGVWESRSCTFPQSIPEDVSAGDICLYASGVIYKDQNGFGDCFECIGFTETEVRTLNYDTTTVYIKAFIDFDEQGGTSVSNKYVYYGSGRTYGTLPTPTRSGYDFNGWFTASTGGTPILSTTVVPSDISLTQILYAQWTLQTPTTATPTISIQYVAPFNIAEYRVRNVDSSGSAVILADSGINPPTTNRGTIAYLGFTSWISLSCQQDNCGQTVYATAQVSGENKSAVRALYVQ